MSEQVLREKFQGFPAGIREKIDNAVTDAKIALEVRLAEMLVDKREMALHAVTTAGRIGLGRRGGGGR